MWEEEAEEEEEGDVDLNKASLSCKRKSPRVNQTRDRSMESWEDEVEPAEKRRMRETRRGEVPRGSWTDPPQEREGEGWIYDVKSGRREDEGRGKGRLRKPYVSDGRRRRERTTEAINA